LAANRKHQLIVLRTAACPERRRATSNTSGANIYRRASASALVRIFGEAIENLPGRQAGTEAVEKDLRRASFVLLTTSPSPRLRGEAVGVRGALQGPTRGNPHSPGELTRADPLPQADGMKVDNKLRQNRVQVYRTRSAPLPSHLFHAHRRRMRAQQFGGRPGPIGGRPNLDLHRLPPRLTALRAYHRRRRLPTLKSPRAPAVLLQLRNS